MQREVALLGGSVFVSLLCIFLIRMVRPTPSPWGFWGMRLRTRMDVDCCAHAHTNTQLTAAGMILGEVGGPGGGGLELCVCVCQRACRVLFAVCAPQTHRGFLWELGLMRTVRGSSFRLPRGATLTNIATVGGDGEAGQALPASEEAEETEEAEEEGEPEEPEGMGAGGPGDVEAAGGAQPSGRPRPVAKIKALAVYKRFSVLDLPFVRRRRRLMWAVRFGLLCVIPAWSSVVLVYSHNFSSLSYVGGLAIIVLLANVSDYVEIVHKV